jgi:hypothetical protein
MSTLIKTIFQRHVKYKMVAIRTETKGHSATHHNKSETITKILLTFNKELDRINTIVNGVASGEFRWIPALHVCIPRKGIVYLTIGGAFLLVAGIMK